MKILKTIFFFFLYPVLIHGQTNLSGSVAGLILTSDGNPYSITDNITIPSGKTLTIKEGCVFLFNPFTGLIVEGSLIVDGSLEKPVIFTTINDTVYNKNSKQVANPFDWNGIYITPKAEKVKLTDFMLKYSVYGVKSQKEQFVINNGTFAQNGQFHVTVNDAIKPVADNIPFNFGATTSGNSKNLQKGSSSWAKPVRMTSGILGIAGLGVAGYFLYSKSNLASKYNKLKTQPERNLNIEKQEQAITIATISGISGGVLLATGLFVYIWNNEKGNKVSISVSQEKIFAINMGISFYMD